ncbi:MAG: ABC transporter ATP-binding protein [Chloroflexota bacterium]|nr:ABC transporter ATP-binding protein [Chloroflexota bacterium]
MSERLIIETKKLSKSFGRLTAVDGLDLKVHEGEIHGFVGPNGAGKSTTLKMLVGAVKSSSGEGNIRGYPIGTVEARKLIGYSPERPSFYSNMTAWDYLVHMANLSGVTLKMAEDRAEELLGWMDLSEFQHVKVGGFSAGMKQRLSLAQAMAHWPKLLILDEPTANLDPGGRIVLLEKLKNLTGDHNISIFISSHILSELEYLVDTVTLIDKGRTVVEDSVQQLKQSLLPNRYVLTTSNNDVVLQALLRKPGIQEAWLDEGVIYIRGDNMSILQRVVMETVLQCDAVLKHFGEEQVKLEDVYCRTVGQDKV